MNYGPGNLDPINYPDARVDILGDDGLSIKVSDDTPSMAARVVGSPEWWRDRLIAKLKDRARYGQAYWRFWEGDQPLAYASRAFMDAYGPRFRNHDVNFMPLIVDAEKNRLIVQGFRFGTSVEADKGLWRIWQDNHLDAESLIAHEIALVKGEAYVLVAPSPDGPIVTIEDPSETIVEYTSGSRRKRAAALKFYRDDDGYFNAYLYLPEYIYKWRTTRRRPFGTWNINESLWMEAPDADEPWPAFNKLGVVPVIALVNRPQRDGLGRSEITPVMGNQLKINFLHYSALVGSDVAALPQRWAKNIDIPVDPVTGQATPPFKAGGQTLWADRRPTPEEVAEYGDQYPEAAFGQFPGADLSPFVTLIRQQLAEMAGASSTPFYYLFGDPGSIPPSGESRKSSEAPLVTKVVLQSVHFGEAWEEVARVILVADGKPSKAKSDGETIWADPETRNEAARTDSLMKQYEQGLLPDEFVLEELGYSQQQIARIAELRKTQPAPAPAGDIPTP